MTAIKERRSRSTSIEQVHSQTADPAARRNARNLKREHKEVYSLSAEHFNAEITPEILDRENGEKRVLHPGRSAAHIAEPDQSKAEHRPGQRTDIISC